MHVAATDGIGGADRAAYRIHKALLATGIDSRMRVGNKYSDDPTVIGRSTRQYFLQRTPYLRLLNLRKDFRTVNPIRHSLAWMRAGLGKELEQLETDIIHLHWLGDKTLTIEEVGQLKRPVVWTLHDMWPFCGAEHLSWDERWREGYTDANRPSHESGFDLNRHVWNRKRKAWFKSMFIVTPSHWLGNCARQSKLMAGWPVTVIPHPLDLSIWRPIEQARARMQLRLPHDRPLVAFGAVGGVRDHHKGADLLKTALSRLQAKYKQMELIIFGQRQPAQSDNTNIPIHYMGHVSDDNAMVEIYCSANVMVVPSRQESFGQTASEALACGTPVVAFDTGGLADIVIHKENGWLARPFDTNDLADGIQWVIEESVHRNKLAIAARASAESRYSMQTIGMEYAALYRRIIEEYRS